MAFVCMCTQFLHGLHVVRLVAAVFLSSIVEVGRKERRKEGVVNERTTDAPSLQYILTCQQ